MAPSPIFLLFPIPFAGVLGSSPWFSRGTLLVLYEHIFVRALTWGSEMGFGSLENLLMAYLR